MYGISALPFAFGTPPRVFASTGIAVLVLAFALTAATPALGDSARVSVPPATVAAAGEAGSLEAAATKAGETGRKVAMSLIGLGFAIAAIVLAFRRDFKEAAGVFVVGFFAILLATPAGVNVLHDTVNSLFGSS